MKLNTLTKLNNKKKMWITPKHPLFFEELDFKILYSSGIFLHAGLNKTVNTLNNFELERLLTKGLGLTGKEVAKVIKLATNGERIIDDIIEILDTHLKKYLFILDLMNVAMRSTPFSEEENQSISIFSELLKISELQKKLLNQFISSAYQMDNNTCISAFKAMLSEHMTITMSELKYYIPEIEYVTNIDNKIIRPGAELQLVDNCRITDSIVIPHGTVLNIENAQIHMNGSIMIDGGTLRIRDSQIINDNPKNRALIQVKNFSEVEILNTVINCRSMGSIIDQENGNLKISRSKIYNTTRDSAIKFWGNQIIIEDSIFKNCFSTTDGGAVHVLHGSGLVHSCRFEECEAKNGGAVHTSDELMIQGCKFKFCTVTEFGAAVYYNGEIKSNLMDCDYYECYPKKEEVIQYIGGMEEKLISKEYLIKVPTILSRPVRVTELGILSIENTILYMNQNIVCMGLLSIKNSKAIAWNFEKRDLFVVENSRGCKIENSEFDGRIKAGIFRATGTKIQIYNCMFRNTAKGRAIYDAFEPVIKNSIFSYCLAGAVNCCSGRIESCSFINCREKSGAGILLYGSRGIIENCRFVRCVSDYSGGAIDMTRGNQAISCIYEDCKPDNIT